MATASAYRVCLFNLTSKVPLILKVREIFFSRAKHIMGHFEGFVEGAETFLAPKLRERAQEREKEREKKVRTIIFLNRPGQN
jgi:hypothetical protein